MEAEIAAIEEVEENIRRKEEEEALIPGAGHVHSFADRLKTGAKEGWSDIERTSRAAAIHAQIEKLRNVDLRKALFALGKKCYESGVLQEELQEQFQQIRDLDDTIFSKQEAGETVDAETKMDALKRIGKDAANSGHAQALTVKRQHLVTELGRQAHASMTEECRPGLEAEIVAIEEVERNILIKEEEARILGAGHAKGWRNRTPAIAVAAVLILLLLAGSSLGLRMMGVGKDDDFDDFPALLARYLSEDGVPQDSTQAFNWYRTAAGQGDAEAQIALALMYSEGEGVVENNDLARKWWGVAAEQGHPYAQYREGARLKWASAGKGAASVRAYMWFDLAASGDHFKVAKAAKERCDELADTMSEAEISEAKQMSRDWKPKQAMYLNDSDPRLKDYVNSLVETFNASEVLLATWSDFQLLSQFPAGPHFRDRPFSEARQEVDRLQRSTAQLETHLKTFSRAYTGLQSSGIGFIDFRPDLEQQHEDLVFDESFSFKFEDDIASKKLRDLRRDIGAMLEKLGAVVEYKSR